MCEDVANSTKISVMCTGDSRTAFRRRLSSNRTELCGCFHFNFRFKLCVCSFAKSDEDLMLGHTSCGSRRRAATYKRIKVVPNLKWRVVGCLRYIISSLHNLIKKCLIVKR